jgi:hypothetical protein
MRQDGGSPYQVAMKTTVRGLAAIALSVLFLACASKSGGTGSDAGIQPDAAPGPDAESCTGCMVGDTCVPGTNEEACGQGGSACITCMGGLQCEDGQCLAPPACNPSNCIGCCDVMGDCVAGTDPSACGEGGGQCAACGPDSLCEPTAGGGQCQFQCGPLTCAGCCTADGTCLTGDDNTGCGSGGGACETCGGGNTCNGGVCVNDVCAATCDGCCRPDGTCNLLWALSDFPGSDFDAISCGRGG